jgi:hypothetical protein
MSDEVVCPKCGGPCWDNRVGKRNPRAPDFKCRDKSCDGVIWPPKPGQKPAAVQTMAAETDAMERAELAAKIAPPAPPAFTLEAAVDEYRKALDLVLETVVPKLIKADIGADPAFINAAVATLLIQTAKRNGR